MGDAIAIGGFGDAGLDLLGRILFSLSFILGREGIVEAIISLMVKISAETDHLVVGG
jgi:hypothetical protein